MAEASYQLSRAAQRQKYGSRSIGYSGQSPLDQTPSGRSKYLQEKGMEVGRAETQVQDEFKDNFKFKLGPMTSPRMVAQQPLAPPNPNLNFTQRTALQSLPEMGDAFQPIRLGLAPETQAEDLADFLPTTTGPLNSFALPKSKPLTGMFRKPSLFG